MERQAINNGCTEAQLHAASLQKEKKSFHCETIFTSISYQDVTKQIINKPSGTIFSSIAIYTFAQILRRIVED